MSADPRVELVRRGLEVYEAGDVETAKNLLHPELEVGDPTPPRTRMTLAVVASTT